MEIRRDLSWQPLFGGGIRGIGWFDTLRLPVDEAYDLLEFSIEQREKEIKAAFPKSSN